MRLGMAEKMLMEWMFGLSCGGGSWYNGGNYLRMPDRFRLDSSGSDTVIGLRCARSVSE